MKKRGKYTKYPFVLVKLEMLDDPEYQRLSLGAKMLWIYLRRQYSPRTVSKNKATGKYQVYLSYRYMRKIKGFQPRALSRQFKELIKAGFIEKTEKGGNLGGRSAYTFVGKYELFPDQE